MNQSIQASTVRSIPLDKLKKSDENVRKVPHTKAEIEALSVSLKAHGQIQNLVVKTETDPNGNPTGCYLVIAGEGRRLAHLVRVKRKEISSDQPIICTVDDTHSATAVSLAENDLRKSSHPYEQFLAFRVLADGGQSIDEIAAQFSVTPLIVKQRLKLANVAPEFIEMYRSGGIELTILMALSLTDDHARQLAVWKSLRKYERHPTLIRERLTQQEIPASDPMVKFVGLKAYEKAGGQVRHDLFAEDGSAGYLMDAALLRKLVDEKLEQEADKVKKEGFAWVEAIPKLDYSGLAAFGHVRPELREPTPEEAEALAVLESRRDTLTNESTELEDDEERCGELDRQIEAVESDIDLLNRRREIPSRDQVAVAGAVLTIDQNGKVRVERNLLKPEDKKKFARAEKAARRATSEGPRVHSAALVRRLTAHRTLALQAELVQQPMMAAIALTHQWVLETFYSSPGLRQGTLQIEVRPPTLKEHGIRLETCPAAATLAAHRKLLKEQLPEDPKTLLTWLKKLSGADLLSILAYCVAVTVDGVQSTEGSSPLDPLARATGLDMTRYWSATAEEYFKSVPRARILEVVREAVSPEVASALSSLKKSALAKAAEERLAGKGWLPASLRVTTA
jgi:ParB family chromosome partitioning protein